MAHEAPAGAILRKVELTWVDSLVSQGTWHDHDTLVDNLAPDALAHRSMGFVVAENDHALVLAHSTNGAGDSFAGAITIPKSAITGGPYEIMDGPLDRV